MYNYNRRMMMGLLAALVLLVAACGLGTLAYDIGLAQGTAQGVVQSAPSGAEVPHAVAPYGYYGHAWGPFGFGFGGVILFLIAVVVGFFILRRLLWGGPMGGRWTRRGFGLFGDEPDGDARGQARRGPYDVPPNFDEWHRRAHAGEGNPDSDQP